MIASRYVCTLEMSLRTFFVLHYEWWAGLYVCIKNVLVELFQEFI